MNISECLDMIVASPDDYRETWMVLSDWLSEAGDLRGNLIQLTALLTGAIDIPDRPLWTILDDARRDYAARPALQFLGRVLSYEKTAGLVERAA